MMDTCGAEITDELLKGTLSAALLELTTVCNLKCVYCARSVHSFKSEVMADEVLETAIGSLIELGVPAVTLNGTGETTTCRNWTEIVRRMRAANISVHLITNLAKPLSDDEIKAFRSINIIEVSLDTHHPALLRQTRRYLDIDTVLENIRKIKQTAPSPQFTVSCVVHSRNLLHIDSFVEWCINVADIKDFNFCNLVKLGDAADGLNVDTVVTLDPAQLAQGVACFNRAVKLIVKHEGRYKIVGGLSTVLKV